MEQHTNDEEWNKNRSTFANYKRNMRLHKKDANKQLNHMGKRDLNMTSLYGVELIFQKTNSLLCSR